MKISCAWLHDHLSFSFSPEELAQKLQALGFEVSSIEKQGPGFEGVVAAQILEIEKHPNADRLSVCQVTDGSENFTVVCGAKNISVGLKVPLARVGATLPGGFKISRSKIRGIESSGMICSGEELGIAPANGGILSLDPGALLGADMALSLGEKDTILDVEVMPNRPDCLSHLGLARELSASLGLPLKDTPVSDSSSPSVSNFSLHIESPADCPVYSGRLIENVVVGPSPAWLVKKLECVGMKSINNVVDITNYILMDLGQPLHAFDADVLEGGEIHVRRAQKGESLRALDDKEYALTPDILVIADKNKPQAIAGVMGGLGSAILSKTKRVFLESANFYPPSIRKASQLLRLRSESSYRFERGTDPNLPEIALRKATVLILSLGGGAAKSSSIRSEKNIKVRPATISVLGSEINKMLGANFNSSDIERVISGLARNGGSLEESKGFLLLTPPSYRMDLLNFADTAEEVARVLGYEKIPSRVSRIEARAASQTPRAGLNEMLRRRFKEAGLYEAYNYDFVSPKDLSRSGMNPDDFPRLANPISDDNSILRPTLLMGLLRNAVLNLSRGNSSIRLFEMGTAFDRNGDVFLENGMAAGLLTGQFPQVYWKPGRIIENDLYRTVGLVMDSLSGFPIEKTVFSENAGSQVWRGLFHPASSVAFKAENLVIGVAGLIHPQAARAWELTAQEILLFEFNLSVLSQVKPRSISVKPLSLFPVSWRDLSILLDEKVPYKKVEDEIRACHIGEIKQIDLADLYSGDKIPQGFQSLTVRITLGRDNGTLTDEEVDGMISKILATLEKTVGARLRQ